jgi:hypothetical protein
LFSIENNTTDIEKFMELRGVVIQHTSKTLGEIHTLDNKKLEFNSIMLKEKSKNTEAKGVEIIFYKSKHSEKFRISYIDNHEIPTLVSNLKEIWNFNSDAQDNQSTGLYVRSNSGFSIGLFELAENDVKEIKRKYVSSNYYMDEENQTVEIKRLVFVATGEAVEEMKKLDDYDDILRLNGFVVLSLENIKDMIIILERTLKE